jgi:predicted DCC family thiol-disulfide oxidoreductase YuxK
MVQLERPVLLYDAACRLCRFTARLVIRLDRTHDLAVLPLQDDEATPILASLPREQRLESWRLACPGGSLVGRGAGLPRLLEAVRLTRPLGPILRRVPESALDRAYDVIARRRGAIGRLAPNGPAPRRFP